MTKLDPPQADRRPQVTERHGQEVVDEYNWLRDRDDPRVLEYLRAENAYTEARLAHTTALQQRLYDEMLGRIQETDLGVPERRGPWFYYSRTEQGKQYSIHCRRRGAAEAEGDEEVVLDGNDLAQGHAYFRLGAYEVSPDHERLAFAVDLEGNERYALRFMRLGDRYLWPETIPETAGDVEWAADGTTVFYTTLDAAHRPHRVWRHRLGTEAAADELIFEEPDEAFFVSLCKTRDGRYLLLELGSKVTTEVHYLDAARPEEAFRVIAPRVQGIEYGVEHHGSEFYILTNQDAVNFRLMAAKVTDLARERWREVLAPDPAVRLESVEPFVGHLVVVARREGIRRLRVFELATMSEHQVELPEPVYAVGLHRNPEFETRLLRFTYTSLVTPRTVYDYDMQTRRLDLKKEEPVLGGYDRTQYRSARVVARAPDGVEVPISLVWREGLRRPGGNPLLLYGYGAYGANSEPAFDSSRLCLLDRGFIWAIAHIRGGGEMGRPWYNEGKLQKKRNTFTDFIACAEHLIAEGYTTPDRLVIRGGSAGGLLVGAVINMRPELFAAALAKVPFVDVINTMFDPSLPLTVVEWEEWGDPRRVEDHGWMRAYSPYDNVTAQAYPHLFVTAGLHDPRVAFWEPAKWVARLRATKTDDRLLLLRTNMEAGHGGASGRYDYLKELAIEWAFVLDRLGESGIGESAATPCIMQGTPHNNDEEIPPCASPRDRSPH